LVAAGPHLSEFERIARFFAPLAGEGSLGLIDDVALIDGPDGEQYALTTDAIIAGIDYFPDDPPGLVAQKLLRVNLSDLAAKGARPFGYLLITALPASHDEAWLAAFCAGLAADQKQYGIVLLGGDSSATPGPATLAVTALGRVAKGKAVLRSGAKPGDLIFVSGTLGDSALGLGVLKGAIAGLSPADRDFLVNRYRLPQPRVALGPKLVEIVNAMIDVSDGLVADLGHIAAASGLAARIRAGEIPLSAAARAALRAADSRFSVILGGGDDYELLFTAHPSMALKIEAAAREAGIMVTGIGTMEAGQGVRVFDDNGQETAVAQAGYSHF
jgi:thiamine-monophosphate kinase